mmetsp:Transcript_50601/g.96627  ORF Transcript_50601/g.96627 Transcript_50601/m.96627 type:complete len:124 (+) Transcript_50601:1-372(+)
MGVAGADPHGNPTRHRTSRRPRVNPTREPAVEMYTANGCTFCAQARDALTLLGLTWLEIDIESEDETPVDVERRVRHARFNTVPQLYVVYKETEEHIGGATELISEIKSGRFQERLKAANIPF